MFNQKSIRGLKRASGEEHAGYKRSRVTKSYSLPIRPLVSSPPMSNSTFGSPHTRTQPDTGFDTTLRLEPGRDDGEQTEGSPVKPHNHRLRYSRRPVHESSSLTRDEMSIRASDALKGSLEDSLIHRKIRTPIKEWSEKGLYTSYGQYIAERKRWPNLRRWEHWEEHHEKYYMFMLQIQKQLERWIVRCPLCLLHRDPSCNNHDLSDCQRSEKALACIFKGRLENMMVQLEVAQLEETGRMPWCSKCCITRNRCRVWNKTYGEGGQEYDNDECRFHGVIMNIVSAMMAFQLPFGETLRQKVDEWREESETQSNMEMGLGGWLLSPLPWEARRMLTIVRVFEQLDMAAEDIWIRRAVEQRRMELNAPTLQQWIDKKTVDDYLPEVTNHQYEGIRLFRRLREFPK